MNWLLIDDDPIWLAKIEQMIASNPSVEITKASSCQETIQLLNEHEPDLVLADIVLPDGFSFTVFPQTKRAYPVIFLTSFPSDSHLQEALSLENSSFLVKPFHELSLQAAIHLALRSVRLKVKPNKDPASGIWIRNRFNQKKLVSFDDIVFLKAEGNYTIIFEKDRKHSLKRSLRSIATGLDKRFVQTQKSYIVNAEYIDRIDMSRSTLFTVVGPLPVGRVYRKGLLTKIP